MDVTRFRTSSSVRASISADGLVLLDVQGGLVLSSNRVGARIWELIERRHTRPEISRQLAEDYGVPGERTDRDVRAFVAALEKRGLVSQDLGSQDLGRQEVTP